LVEQVMYRINRKAVFRAFLQAAVLGLISLAVALSANALRPSGGIALVADWSPQARLMAAWGEGFVIPLEQAVEFYDTREAVFVDARPAWEYEEGRIPGAIHLPWQGWEQYMAGFLDAVPDPHTIVIAYCDGEACELSEGLALLLREMGYKNAVVLINGMTVWEQAGYPVEKGPDAGSLP